MKAFVCSFSGHYPVGACAVVVDTDVESARVQLEYELDKIGLKQTLTLEQLEEIDMSSPGVNIVNNGDY